MRDDRGFTMVELIVVMAILVVLASMALPAFAKIKDKAREVRAMEEIRGLEKAIGAYSIDKGGTLPPNLAALLIPIPLDPWGHSYIYHQLGAAGVPSDGAPRTDVTGVLPLNTDYDLYSRGPDGVTNPGTTDDPTSYDDVVRSGDGGYVGMAKYP
jgi:general secretion pathway protein G